MTENTKGFLEYLNDGPLTAYTYDRWEGNDWVGNKRLYVATWIIDSKTSIIIQVLQGYYHTGNGNRLRAIQIKKKVFYNLFTKTIDVPVTHIGAADSKYIIDCVMNPKPAKTSVDLNRYIS